MWAVRFSSRSVFLFLSVCFAFYRFFSARPFMRPRLCFSSRPVIRPQQRHCMAILGKLSGTAGNSQRFCYYGESSSSRTNERKTSHFFQIWCVFECRLSKPHWVLTTHSSPWWAFLSGSSSSIRCFPTPPQCNHASRPHQFKLLLITTLPGALSYFGRPVWKPFLPRLATAARCLPAWGGKVAPEVTFVFMLFCAGVH